MGFLLGTVGLGVVIALSLGGFIFLWQLADLIRKGIVSAYRQHQENVYRYGPNWRETKRQAEALEAELKSLRDKRDMASIKRRLEIREELHGENNIYVRWRV